MSKPIDQELLPCPCCGGADLQNEPTYIMCNGCGLMIDRCDAPDHDFRAAWNTRASVHPAGVAVPEALRTAIMRADGVLSSLTACTTPLERLKRNHGHEWTKAIDGIRRDLLVALAVAPHPVSGERHTCALDAASHCKRCVAKEALSPENQRITPAPPLLAPRHPFDKPSLLKDCNVSYSDREQFTAPPAAQDVSDIEAMVTSLENREWADHMGVSPLGQRLESAITDLINRQKDVAGLVEALETAHRFIESTEAFGLAAASGILECGDVQWDVDASKALIAAHRAKQGEQPS